MEEEESFCALWSSKGYPWVKTQFPKMSSSDQSPLSLILPTNTSLPQGPITSNFNELNWKGPQDSQHPEDLKPQGYIYS